MELFKVLKYRGYNGPKRLKTAAVIILIKRYFNPESDVELTPERFYPRRVILTLELV